MSNISEFIKEELNIYNELSKTEFIREFEVLVLAILDKLANSKKKRAF